MIDEPGVPPVPEREIPVYEDSEAPEPPAHWEADVVVADGGTVHLRPVRPSDAPQLVALHARLSPRTRYLRYFSAYPRVPERDLYRFSHVDHVNRVAFLVELNDVAIAVGRYERVPGADDAEVAFVVDDENQGRGIGSVLLEHLAAAGRERGLKRFTAVVLAENPGMVRVFRDAGYAITREFDHGEVNLEFAIDETATTESVMREREQRAEARSIERLLFPSSVAVIGASNDPGKIGGALFANLLRMGFDGPIYPVNAEARHVGGVPAYPSVLDIGAPVDLAVIAVPVAGVREVVRQCARRGVRGLVVASGGFGEGGDEEGLQQQRALVAYARSHGMRVVGPNCLGVINTAEGVRLNASLAPLPPLPGRIGFFCQSGALGVAVLGEAARRGLGVSTFVSAGNRADVSGNDLLQFWENDEHTDVVLMYLESFGNPRKFVRLARRHARHKPVIAVKSGTGPVVRALENTTNRLPEVSIKALFEASGVIRVDTVGGMFDTALLLASQPLPGGDRVAVVGNSTAIGVLVANACAAENLSLARIDDVGVTAGAVEFEGALRAALQDDAVDSVVVVFVPPLQRAASEDVARVLREIAAAGVKPVLSTFLGFEGVPAALAVAGDSYPERGSVPSYPSPERAVRALARAVRYASWRNAPWGEMAHLDGLDPAAGRDLVARVLQEAPDGRPLTGEEAGMLLGCVGVRQSLEVPASAVEVLLGLFDDRSFGALVSFGIAGVATELLADRAYAAVPLTTADADRLIATPRAAPLLTGYHGAPPCDLGALADLALRLSVLGDELPEVAECELRVAAAPFGAHVIAIEVQVSPPTARGDTGPRRMPGL